MMVDVLDAKSGWSSVWARNGLMEMWSRYTMHESTGKKEKKLLEPATSMQWKRAAMYVYSTRAKR
jgi:hypothetical protein